MNATQNEEWRPVPGHEGAYEVSDQGRVRSVDRMVLTKTGHQYPVRGRYLGSLHKSTGYIRVDLRGEMHHVHRLVLLAFVGPLPQGQHSCHSNGDQTDNRLANLRYDTVSANIRDSVDHGTQKEARKTHCPKGHPYDAANTYFPDRPSRPGKSRRCRTCNRDRCRERYALGLK
jgi:hypothetical protein